MRTSLRSVWPTRVFSALGLVALLSIEGRAAAQVTVCPSGSTLEGVDVSVYEGTVDWPTLKIERARLRGRQGDRRLHVQGTRNFRRTGPR